MGKRKSVAQNVCQKQAARTPKPEQEEKTGEQRKYGAKEWAKERTKVWTK